jgi:geranylgeranyl diphosphate synthase type I
MTSALSAEWSPPAISPDAGAKAFAAYAARVKPGLDVALAAYLERASASVAGLPRDVIATVEAVRDLSLRGGKRLRAVLLAAGYDACGGEGGADRVVMAGVSLELLQAYLLIHDDWMDGDDTRRGGPSVPAMVRDQLARFGAAGRDAASAFAILAGDFAAGLSMSALAEVPVAPGRVAAAMAEMGRIQRDVVLGQMCDVHGELGSEPPTAAAVELTHTLKTSSYTVRGPLLLGARLAGASPDAVRALEGFGDPVGVAFQLKDDLLGTFGDPARTGKPVASDIRQGKRTGLIAALAEGSSPDTAALLSRAFGKRDASAADVEALVEKMVSSGARRRVEEQIEALVKRGLSALDGGALAPSARELLAGAAHTLTHRET